MLIFSILAHIIVNVKNQAELAEHQPEVSEQLLKKSLRKIITGQKLCNNKSCLLAPKRVDPQQSPS